MPFPMNRVVARMSRHTLRLASLAVAAACGTGDASPPKGAAAGRQDSARVIAADTVPPPAPLVSRPAAARGLYVNRWAARGPKMWRLIDGSRRTETRALARR